MNRWFTHRPLIALIAGIILLSAGGAGFYMVREVTSRMATLESQVALLAAALEESGDISANDVRALRELTNQGSVSTASQDELLTGAVERAAPAVVSIVVSKDMPLLEVAYVNPFGDDPYFRNVPYRVPVWKQVGTKPKHIGAGTGFVVREDGYIVTNQHVVDDPEAEYLVLLSTGEKKAARVAYRDQSLDIALLKIDGRGYDVLPFGDSDSLKLGQTVAAIGNALGEYNNTVSVGIISGLNRTVEAADTRGYIEELKDVIQTDASINRGNSGGPLVDLNGAVMGINVAVDQQGNNIAFAIPSNDVKRIIERVLP